MKKTLLMTPGPAQVPPQTLAALAQPIFHHRTPEYKALHAEVVGRLRSTFLASGEVVLLASSGTGAMEASVVNVKAAGRKALCIAGGKFGERWAELCKVYGFEHEVIDMEWGKSVDPKVVADKLAADKSISAVYATLCETSTGAEHDIKSIGEVVSKTGAILVVDAISGGAGCELRFDDWGVDMLVVGSQKALMMPPGLAVLIVSDKAKGLIEAGDAPSYYFDLKKALKKAADNDTPYTPANTLIRALNASLAMIEAEGVEDVFSRHRVLAEATRAGVKALGLGLLAERPAAVVTAVTLPDGVDGGKVAKTMEAKYGVKVAGGQEALKGRILRIAHMGWCSPADVVTALAALERSLKDVGAEIELGAGVKAAQEVFAKAGV